MSSWHLRRLRSLPSGRAVTFLATLGFAVGVDLATRLLPALLHAIGSNAVVVGSFASLAALARVCYPGLARRPTFRRFRHRLGPQRTRLALGSVAVFGATCWAIAPMLGTGQFGGGLAVSVCVALVGSLFAGLWTALGPGSDVDAASFVAGRVPEYPTHWPTVAWLVAPGVLVPVVGVFLAGTPITPGIQVLAALLAAVGVVGIVAEAVSKEGGSMPERLAPPLWDRNGRDRSSPDRPSLLASVDRLVRLDAVRQRVVVGDVLLGVAAAMIDPVLMLALLDGNGVVSVAGITLDPMATFAALLCVEATAALSSILVVRWIVPRFGELPVVVGGGLAVALFPLWATALPLSLPALAVGFGTFGLRVGARVVRRRYVADRVGGYRSTDPRWACRRLRNVAVVPAGLLSGLLYAVGPALPFGVAAVIGMLGVERFVRAVEKA